MTPGKVAIWIFLATEIMFFTGLIGAYIVLRAGSPRAGYSNLYVPALPLSGLAGSFGVVIDSVGNTKLAAVGILQGSVGLDRSQAEAILEQTPGVVADLSQAKAEILQSSLATAGLTCHIEPLRTSRWPRPFDSLTNPLSVNLTALNTLILSCSSISMMFALASIQRGKRWRSTLFLGLTLVLGSVFLSVQALEYRELLFERHYPAGISASGHFLPSSSLFASCFFAMTGFHGLHVTGGLIALASVFVRTLFGAYSRSHYAPIEIVGLYWHFVDLVWVILFTLVYLI